MAKTILGKVSITPKGQYNEEAQYKFLDVISFNGCSYLVKKDCIGMQPPNDEYYMTLSEKGDTPEKGVDYFTSEEKQEIIDEVISSVGDAGGGSPSQTSIYKVQASEEQDDLEALGTVATSPNKGDIGIVTRVIHEDKISYTAYVYNSSWEAMDGNYNADNVYFSTDLTITANIGVHTIDASGSKTLSTTGKSIKQVFDLLLAEEKNPSITQPSVSVTSSEIGAKEVGTRVTPSFNVSLNPGSYQYGPATGVTVTSYIVTDSNDNSLTTQSGSFEEIQVTDDTTYTITAVVEHTEGTVPKTNLGNEYLDGKIQAGSKSATTSGKIVGYRNSFYGTTEDKETPTDSAVIRALVGKSNKALKNGDSFTINIPIGATRVIFAYPNTLKDVTSVKDTNGLNAEISTGFTKSEIEVRGANDYTGIQYKVYTMDYSAPNDTVNSYKVTI